MKKRKTLSIYLLPSFLTTINIFLGYLSIIYILKENYKLASFWIFLAAVIDALDGIFARLTKTTTDFGIQFDSLADVVSFGVAPSVLLYFWGLKELGRVGWVFSFLFITAGILRLARFNILQSSYLLKKYSIGLSIPAASLAIVSIVYFRPLPIENIRHAYMLALFTLILSLLMISKLRYLSYKALTIKKTRELKSILLIALILAGITVYPRLTFLCFMQIYVFSAPITFLIKQIKKKFKTQTKELNETSEFVIKD
jgi:CDP-diacylglycerol--serine O-phosphatidyltransferase